MNISKDLPTVFGPSDPSDPSVALTVVVSLGTVEVGVCMKLIIAIDARC